MSGSVVPGINSETEDDVRLRMQGEAPEVVAAALQRFAQNDPRFEEKPEDNKPAEPVGPAIMAGFDRIGLNATAENNPNDPRNQAGAATPQTLKEDTAELDSLFTGTSQAAQREAYNLETSGAGGGISGKSFGSELQNSVTSEEKKEREAWAAILASSLNSMQSLQDDLDWMFRESEQIQADFDEAETVTHDTFDLLQQEIIEAGRKIEEQHEKINALKQQLENETDPEKRTQLEAQIAAAQAESDNANALYLANYEAYKHLNGKYHEAKEQLDASQKEISRLQHALNNKDATEEERQKLRELIEAEKLKLADAGRKIEDLKQTAQTIQDTVHAARNEGGLSQARTAELINTAKGDPQLSGIIGSIGAAMMGSGMYITGDDGQKLTGEEGSQFFVNQINKLDIERAELRQRLEAADSTPGADEHVSVFLRAQLEAKNQQRLELENKAGACFADQTELGPRQKADDEFAAKDTTFSIKDDAGAVVGSYEVALLSNQLTLVSNTGEKFALKDMAPEEQRMVLGSLQAGLAEGKVVSPEIAVALAAASAATVVATTPAAPALNTPDPSIELARLAAASVDRERIEQERLEKQATERMMMGGSMSAEEYERMKRILGAEYAAKLAEENKVQVQTGIFAELTGFSLGPTATRNFLFAGMAGAMVGREIAAGAPLLSAFGISGGGYSSFADSMDFNQYNDPKMVEPSYAFAGIPVDFGLANMFGLGGPSQQQSPQGPSFEEQSRMRLEQQLAYQRQQELLASMGLNGPKLPPSGQQA